MSNYLHVFQSTFDLIVYQGYFYSAIAGEIASSYGLISLYQMIVIFWIYPPKELQCLRDKSELIKEIQFNLNAEY